MSKKKTTPEIPTENNAPEAPSQSSQDAAQSTEPAIGADAPAEAAQDKAEAPSAPSGDEEPATAPPVPGDPEYHDFFMSMTSKAAPTEAHVTDESAAHATKALDLETELAGARAENESDPKPVVLGRLGDPAAPCALIMKDNRPLDGTGTSFGPFVTFGAHPQGIFDAPVTVRQAQVIAKVLDAALGDSDTVLEVLAALGYLPALTRISGGWRFMPDRRNGKSFDGPEIAKLVLDSTRTFIRAENAAGNLPG